MEQYRLANFGHFVQASIHIFLFACTFKNNIVHIDGILLKGPYLPCLRMAYRPCWQDSLDMSVGFFTSAPNNQIKVYDYSVRPHPIWLPGTIEGEGSGELFTRLDDISIDLTLLKRVGIIWTRIPCIDMVGSWYVATMMKVHLQQY